MMSGRGVLALIALVLVVAACDSQVSIEPTPDAFRTPGGICPGDHLDETPGTATSGDWGSATALQQGIEYTVNDGWTVTFCAKGGNDSNSITVTGRDSGTLSTPENQGGNIPDLSHWSVTGITPPDVTTTTSGVATTTTDTPASPTEVPDTTTTAGAATTEAPDTTTTAGTATMEAPDPTTTAGATTTTADPGTTTTVVAGDTTTTADPASGGESGASGGEAGSGSEDDGDEELAFTGPGDLGPLELTGVALLGPALVVVGGGLVALTRRRSG